jgi:hypothetical protein
MDVLLDLIKVLSTWRRSLRFRQANTEVFRGHGVAGQPGEMKESIE